jgi:hypothetical protein
LTLAITDVAGPPAPPERFSSLPIRGADAAAEGGADGSGLEFNCGMAQVFEILTENRTAAGHQARYPGTRPNRRSLPYRSFPLDR